MVPPPLVYQGLARERPTLVARCHPHSVGELVWGYTWELQVPARPNKKTHHSSGEMLSLLLSWVSEGISEDQESPLVHGPREKAADPAPSKFCGHLLPLIVTSVW